MKWCHSGSQMWWNGQLVVSMKITQYFSTTIWIFRFDIKDQPTIVGWSFRAVKVISRDYKRWWHHLPPRPANCVTCWVFCIFQFLFWKYTYQVVQSSWVKRGLCVTWIQTSKLLCVVLFWIVLLFLQRHEMHLTTCKAPHTQGFSGPLRGSTSVWGSGS